MVLKWTDVSALMHVEKIEGNKTGIILKTAWKWRSSP